MKTFRSLLRVLVLFCLAGFSASVCDAQTPPTRIYPFGDSLTSGTTVVGAYRNSLYDQLTSAGFSVDFVGTETDASNPALPDNDHQGMGGFRIAQLQDGLPWWLNQIEAPDVVLLMIGTNDFSAGDDVANAPNRLASLISDITTRLPFAKVIVATLPLRTDSATLEAQQVAFNATIPGIVADQVSLGRQVTLVDMHAVLDPGDLEEGVHPTAGGYGKLADAWVPAINNVITPLGTADPPAIAGTGPATDLQQIPVTFSKPVADSAANIANFSVSGGVTISGATLDAATKRTVTLTTSAQTPGALYTITVNGVQDRTPEQNETAANTTAYFTALTLTNGSFEDGEAGWSMSGNRLVYDTTPPYIASHGTRMLIMNGGQTTPNAYISQDFGTVPGQTYRVDYDAGVFALNTSQQQLGVQITGNATHLAEAQILTGNGLGNTVWVPKSHTFTADSAVTNLAFGDLSATSNSIDLLLDHVSVTAVPAVANSAPVAVGDSYSTPVDTALAIAAPGVLGNDSDIDADPLTAALDTAPANGSVTLDADGGFTYTPDAGYTGPDSFSYHASDGDLDSNIATVNLTVTPDVPVLLVNGGFEEGETGWSFSGNYLVYDSDGSYIASEGDTMLVMNGGQTAPSALVSQPFATVPGQTYTLEYDLGFFSLNTSQQSLGIQIDGVANLLSEIVTISGNGQGNTVWTTRSHTFVADSSQASLSFSDLSTTTNGIDLLLDNVSVVAGGTPANTAPVATDDTYQTDGDTALVISAPGLLANDSDAEGDPLAAALDTDVTHGTLALNSDGGFTYTPDAGFAGDDSFTYIANDGELDSNVATVTITVIPSNSAPVAADDSYQTVAGVALAVPAAGVLDNDSDPDGDPITAALEAGPANGTLDLDDDGGFTYTPDPGFFGADSFTYRATDGELDSNIATVSLTVTSDVPGTLVNGSFEDGETGWAMTGNHLVYESDGTYVASDGSFMLVLNGGQGTPNALVSQPFVTVPGETYTVSYDIGVIAFNTSEQRLGIQVDGSATLLAEVDSVFGDGSGNTVWTTVSHTFTADSTSAVLAFGDLSPTTTGIDLLLDNVVITTGGGPVNTAPVATDDSYPTDENTDLVVPAPGVLANDSDADGDPLAAILDTDVANGTLTLNSDGGFTYVPDTDFTGADSFSYHVNDGELDSNIATVTLTIDSTNTAPVATDDSYQTDENTDLVISAPGVIDNDSDVDGDPLTAVLDTDVENGTLTLNPDGGFNYVPDTDFTGADSFTYHVNDGDFDSNVATVSLTVASTVPGALVNGSFEDGENGWTMTGNHLVYESDGTYIASDGSFMLVLNGGQGTPNALVSQPFATVPGETYTISYDVGVIGFNTSEQRLGIQIDGNTTLLAEVDSVFGDGSGNTVWTPVSHPFTADSTSAVLAFGDLSPTTTGIDLLLDNVVITTGGGPVNTAPVATDDSYPTDENTDLVVPTPGVLANDSDADGDPLAAILDTDVANGTLTLDPDGGFTYVPDADFTGADSFSYHVSDGELDSDIATVTLTIDSTNTAPVAADDSYQTVTGVILSLAAPGVLANDSDEDGDPLTAVLDTAPANGSLTLNSDGSLTYTPDTDYTGPDSFTYHANDGELDSNIATVSLTVFAPNSAPESITDSYSVAADSTLAIPAPGVLANDSDADGDELTAVLDSAPGHGTLTLDPDGGFTYTPAPGFTGPDTFSYHATDGSLESGPTVVNLAVFDPAAELIVNGSFESDYNGWNAEGIQEIAYYPTTDGIKSVAFNSQNRTPDATLSQAFPTVPGQTYTLSFDMGVLSYVRRTMTLGVMVEGEETLLSRNSSLRGAGEGGFDWVSRTYTFIADSAVSTLIFEDRSANTIGIDVLLDNVVVTGQSTGGNEAPEAVPDSYSTRADTPLVVAATGVLANDFSPQATPLTAVLDAIPANGELDLSADGGFTYTPDPGFTGVDAFSYHAESEGLNSNNVLVTITVTPQDADILVNPSFESDFTGWTATGNTSIEYYGPTDGIKVADFNSQNRSPNGTLSQSFLTAPGTVYTLEFDAGVISYTSDSQTLGVSVTGNSNLLSQTVTIDHEDGSVIRWQSRSFTFLADSTTTTLEFRDLSSATVGIDLLVDHIRITEQAAPVVEPDAIALPIFDLGTPTLSTTATEFVVDYYTIQSGTYILERSGDCGSWDYIDETTSDGLESIQFRELRSEVSDPKVFYRIGYKHE